LNLTIPNPNKTIYIENKTTYLANDLLKGGNYMLLFLNPKIIDNPKYKNKSPKSHKENLRNPKVYPLIKIINILNFESNSIFS